MSFMSAESSIVPATGKISVAGIVVVLVFAMGIGAWIFVHHRSDAAEAARPAEAAPVAVTTAPVQARNMPIYLAGIGTVMPTQSVTVRTRIDGQLDKIGFTEGQDVTAGQLIARLDPRTLQAQLAQARAQRGKDAAQLANARVDLRRYSTLVAQDSATRQQLDTQKALVAQLEATVQTDDAQINYAQVQLSFTEIKAPISGRVGARLVDVGNIVHATDPSGIVVINQIDPISVVFALPAEGFQQINRALRAHRKPLTVEVYLPTSSALLGRGDLVLLNNQIDTASGTVQLKASFSNAQHTLWPGQYVDVRLVLGVREQALTVPTAAVQRSQTGLYVYTVDAGGQTVQNVPVEVAQMQDGLAIIDKGLAAGQLVVVDGQYKLKPGARITSEAHSPAGATSARTVATQAGSPP